MGTFRVTLALVILFVCVFWLKLTAQDAREAGIPEIRNIAPSVYQASPVNYAITQDSLGILYIANEAGVLIYDGSRWDLVRLPGNGPARSLGYANGKVFVGGVNRIGFLQPDSLGRLQFQSLNPFLPDSLQSFKAVGEVVAIGDTVYFRSYYLLMRWDGQRMRYIQPQTVFFNGMRAGNTFVVTEWKVGVKYWAGDSLRTFPGSSRLAGKTIAGIFPDGENRWIVLTRFQGAFLLSTTGIQPLKNTPPNFWWYSLVYRAGLLSDSWLALATHRRGLALADRQGRLVSLVDRASGLRDNTVNFIHTDAQGGIWLALSNGLARVDIPSAYTWFNYQNGLDGSVLAITRYRDTLFVATHLGLFKLRPGIDPSAHFQKIKGIGSAVYALQVHRDRLFIGTHRGLYYLRENRGIPLETGGSSVTAIASTAKDMLVGTYQDVRVIGFSKQGEWQYRGIVQRLGQVRQLTRMADGMGWVVTQTGVYRFLYNREQAPGAVTRYDSSRGVPPGAVTLSVNRNAVRLIVAGRIFAYRHRSDQFVPDSVLGVYYRMRRMHVSRIIAGAEGFLWVTGQKAGRLFCHRWSNTGGTMALQDSIPAYRLAPLGTIQVVFPEGNNRVWIGGSEGLLRYDGTSGFLPHSPIPVFILQVAVRDSLFFFGESIRNRTAQNPLTIPFSLNDIRIHFSAPYYRAPEDIRYRYYLEGYDTGWSGWHAETYRDYTGLPPGSYRFQVQARNGDGQLSAVATFSFTILPPWYRSGWAYLGYAILLVLLVVGMVRWRVRHLKRRTRQLESLVQERTATIQQQAQRLKELDRMKSRFLANISHEFRTPLTLILGPLEDWLAGDGAEGNNPTTWNQMHRAGKRLLRLVNQLLDLSRLEAGKLTLSVTRGDFLQFLRSLTSSFVSLAKQKGIHLQFTSTFPELTCLEVYFDPDKMETIFSNLLANAIQYTPQGGQVFVDCRRYEPKTHATIGDRPAPAEIFWVDVRVQDSGPGIPPGDLPHIFDRFYQVDSRRSRSSTGGVGIGLALVKELTELHHGQIEVESDPGEGTSFTLRFPLHRAAYSDEELRESPQQEPADKAPKMKVASLLPETSISPGDASLPLVMVVEDHEDVRHYVGEHLRAEYRILEAADGEEALLLAVKHMPELIISDVMMPGMDGFELCRKLKNDIRTSHIPIILLTARAGEESKISGLETGADDYLIKPFNSRELRVRVRNLIEQRQRLRDMYRREGLLELSTRNMPSVEKAFMQRLREATEAGIEQERFGPQQLSEALGMTRRTLQRKIRALTGQSPSEFIRSVRLRRAKQLLEQRAGNVSEICYRVGFESLPYFTRCFKKEFGIAPSQLLKHR